MAADKTKVFAAGDFLLGLLAISLQVGYCSSYCSRPVDFIITLSYRHIDFIF